MTPHESYGSLQTDDRACFLCGNDAVEIGEEHVFAKWLQGRFNLWNLRLDLLNKTSITYKNLKIPCCTACNTGSLSGLETTIGKAVAGGYEVAVSIAPRSWYLWAAKLFFGLLRKELNLRRDQVNPKAGNIVSDAGLKSFSSLHLFLQGIRERHSFSGRTPYSVLVCNLHDLGGHLSYSFHDNLMYMTLAIRMGSVGIIVALEDCGLTEETYGRYVREVGGRKLHPAQFDELYARVSYQVSLIQSSVTYVTAFDVAGHRSATTDVVGAVWTREWVSDEWMEVASAHLAQWLCVPPSGDVSWAHPSHVGQICIQDESGAVLVRSMPEWMSERKSGD